MKKLKSLEICQGGYVRQVLTPSYFSRNSGYFLLEPGDNLGADTDMKVFFVGDDVVNVGDHSFKLDNQLASIELKFKKKMQFAGMQVKSLTLSIKKGLLEIVY